MQEKYVLEAKGISKLFPGVLALDNVDFKLKEGEVHAVVGENGAGKSTLMHILCGIHRPNSGQIFMGGEEIICRSPIDAQQQGIGIVFQELSLIPELSIAENIFTKRQPANKLGIISRDKLKKQTKALLDTFNENINPMLPVKLLTIAKQQVVEILKAISNKPKVLILDEPTSSLTQVETKRLFENIKILKSSGISIIYISHHLQEIFEIADRATVLKDGKYVSTVNISDVNEEKIVSLMVGRDVSHEYINRQDKIDYKNVVLETKNLTHESLFSDISIKVHAGEILGMAGLIGAGRSEFARTLFGLDKAKSGEILLNGENISIGSSTDAIDIGIAYTSENRKLEGLFLSSTIKDNCVSPKLSRFSGKFIGVLDNKLMEDYAKMCIERFNISTPSTGQFVRNLSGGNQQKVLLSMWLGIQPKVLIADEPTKGVDVGAKAEIYEILRKLADSGVAVIVISSDLLEVLTISDNIIVMKSGKVVGELKNNEANEENIISYATGVRV
jgi:ABC-type sugar transport system ATPase subunit